MRRFGLLLASLLTTCSLFVSSLSASEATSFDQAGQRKAAVRIRNWINGYQRAPLYGGSGTLTAVQGDSGLVLTAAHLFEGKVGPITVEFSNGEVSGATLGAIDEKLDVAALWVYAPEGIEPLPLDKTNPELGEQVEIWGFGPERFRSFAATVSYPIEVVGEEPNVLIGAQGVENRMVTIPGDSGGSMVKSGKLVGVHWGYRGADNDPRRSVHAVGCGRIRSWLRANLTEPVANRFLGM
jgi:S1-C subfamily serine protease